MTPSQRSHGASEEARELLADEDVRKTVIDVLAEFFQDSFDDDPMGVGDWLAQNGTSVDLFIELVGAIRAPSENALRRCQKCGCLTNSEEALVGTEIWCHPCADAHSEGARND